MDDSRVIRVLIGRILRELGFEIVEAANGSEALAVLATAGIVDVALVDWNMPEMNGYELVCAVRRDRDRDGMRILMVTTETDAAFVTRALQAGADEYLMKPFTRDMFQDKLAILGLLEAA